METILNTGIILLNVFSIILTIKMLKGFDLIKMIAFLIGGVLLMFVLSTIIYSFTGSGISENVHNSAKSLMIYTMTPINTMLIYCPIISTINKHMLEEISNEKYSKRIVIIGAVSIAVILIEVVYIKNIQLGIASYAR